MLEPQARHQDALRAVCQRLGGQIHARRALLGRAPAGAVAFYETDDGAGGTGSSVLPELSDVARQVVQLPMQTLDDVLREEGMGPPDLLKLDVQGYELEVLAGAGEALRETPLVLLEVSLVQYNAGSPLIHELLSWMNERGFRAREIFDISRLRTGELAQLDILFAR
jgi:FkbM family methyltransferase